MTRRRLGATVGRIPVLALAQFIGAKKIGAVACPDAILFARDLPKTRRSGKISVVARLKTEYASREA